MLELGCIFLLLGLVSLLHLQWKAKMNLSFIHVSQRVMEALAVQTRMRARACAGADSHGKQRNVTR